MFLPQCFVYASDTEITDKIEQQMLEKIDMSEIEKYSKDYLPDRLSFSDIVDAILAGPFQSTDLAYDILQPSQSVRYHLDKR